MWSNYVKGNIFRQQLNLSIVREGTLLRNSLLQTIDASKVLKDLLSIVSVVNQVTVGLLRNLCVACSAQLVVLCIGVVSL